MTYLKEWVRALESGLYEQAQKQLKDDEGRYCCLGVAGVVLTEHEENIEWKCGCLVIEENFLRTELNELLRSLLGITGSEEGEYIRMNDQEGADFKQIAARIRENHPESFNS